MWLLTVVLLTPAMLLLLLPTQLVLVAVLMLLLMLLILALCSPAAACCTRRLPQGRSFYRIVDRFIDQSGANTESIYGGAFKDDPGGLAMKHDRRVREGGGRTWRCIKHGYQKDNQVDP